MTISQLLYPVLSKSFTLLFISVVLTACSTDEDFTGSTTGAGTEVVQEATPEPVSEPSQQAAPVATLSVSPSRIDLGQSATLSWSATNASSCTASGGWSGAPGITGSQIVSPAATVNYILTCDGAGGSVSDSVSVTVITPPPPVPVVNLSVSSPSIDQGQSATLSWSATNASSCTASGGWSGTPGTTGSQIVSPAATSIYILSCNGAGGSASDSVSVTVNAPPPPVPVVNLSVSSPSIDQGQSATLSWSSTNASSCMASGGWSGTPGTTGSQIVSPAATSIYILSCNGAGGSASDSVSVTVNAPPPPVPVVNLSVSSPSIDQGQSATLSWSSSNASSCMASGGWSGAPGITGSQIVSPAATVNYILTCDGAGGSVSDSVSVTVIAPPPPVPVVNLSVSSPSIDQGQSATLSWSATNASSCTASGGWSGTPGTTGSQIVSPAATSIYILSCNGAGGSASDSVSVTVNAPPPPVPVVNLSVSSPSIDQGQSATLSWSSTNASSCTASGGWSGTPSITGSQIVSPAATVNYILTCNGAGGSVSDSVILTVNQQPNVDTGNFQTPALTCGEPTSVCYDIIYVRFPIAKIQDAVAPGGQVALPSGETPYTLESGADLMLLRQDGTEIVLVDCTDCSVMDPFISYDGKTVYYSYNEKVMSSPYGDEYASWIYKIHLQGHPGFNNYQPIRLTFNDGFDSVQFKANQGAGGNIKSADHDQSKYRAIRDMSPIPLADGRLLFTSNRSALTAFHPDTNAIINGSIQQLYVMDDHDGTAVTRELANIQQLETGNIHQVQHPIQLKDGRILFSTWQDAGTKMNKLAYAMTPLFTVNPDGSSLKQFTEPHDHHKNVEHFISQLSDGQVVWGQYYPHLEGYGIILRAPVSSGGPDFLRDSNDQKFTSGSKVSFREFDRVGTVTITPHTNGTDAPATNLSGKYSMPSAVVGGGLLVAYSTGSVNQTDFVCSPVGRCESLKSGIYLIPNATGGASSFITDPVTQLIQIKDDPNYNEIWPRAVLSYGDIHGLSKPDLLNDLSRSLPDDNRLLAGEAKALLGTSSIYNREPLNEADPDPFYSSTGREFTDGNWTVQGAEAGVFTNGDIYGVRIIATPPKPYTKPIKASVDSARWNGISRHLLDNRLKEVVARYGSAHGERWEILGEFPVKKPSVTDGQGNPDTSWLAKIPSDVPTFIQTIDNKGMTLVSELTWRALKSGEKRADCGGCHAHSVAPLDIATTEAGQGKPIVNIVGVNSAGPEVKDGVWDLTLNKIPLLNETGVTFKPGYSYGVEFNRDVIPILNNRCVSCHRAGQPAGAKLVLDNDPWSKISQTGDYSNNVVQVSRYIRTPQARQSLLVWATWGERLDGRTNAERSDDIDFAGHPIIPGITDEEKRTIARWVDLGSPIDFPQTDGMGYTDDYQLPVINIYTPHLGDNTSTQLKVGFNDAKSGLDWNTLAVKYYKIGSAEQTLAINVASDVNAKDILTKNLALGSGEYVITVSVNDMAGNTGLASRRFKIN